MDTEQLEKQLSIWNRLLYAAFGASITILVSSLPELLGVVWLVLQIFITSSAFFLLWGKRWRTLPVSKERVDMVLGYFISSWFLSLVPGMLGADSLYYIIVFGYAIFILAIYKRTQKALAVSDAMFPYFFKFSILPSPPTRIRRQFARTGIP
jgi:hypothetical protein